VTSSGHLFPLTNTSCNLHNDISHLQQIHAAKLMLPTKAINTTFN